MKSGAAVGMSIEAMEDRTRARRRRWVEDVRRLGHEAHSQIATPTSLALAVGAGFVLERTGGSSQVLHLFQHLTASKKGKSRDVRHKS
jgi:hypothetical protein